MYLEIEYKNGEKFTTRVREVFTDKEYLVYYREQYYKGEEMKIKIKDIQEAYTINFGYKRFYVGSNQK